MVGNLILETKASNTKMLKGQSMIISFYNFLIDRKKNFPNKA